MNYLNKLVSEGLVVLQSRKSSGHPFIYDQVDSISYHKWVLNCVSFLGPDAPEQVAQIKAVYKANVALHHQAEQIFAILSSAVEFIQSKKEHLSPDVVKAKSPMAFSLEFLNNRLVEKCSDHFYAAKYDDCILNAAKLVEVMVREAAKLEDTDFGVQLMRKALKPDAPIIRFSNVSAEQEAVMNLFCGFIGYFKNPHSHKFMNVSDPLTTFEILGVANHLCNMLAKTVTT